MSSIKFDGKKRQWLLVSQLLFATIIAVTLAASNYQTSQAASLAPHINETLCANPGKLVDTYPIKYNGTTVGVINLYYNRAAGGYNCVWARATGTVYGNAQYIKVTIEGCNSNEGEECASDGYDIDEGEYRFYAGPAAVTQSSGACISVYGQIAWRGEIYEGGTNGKAAHCGA